MASVLVAAPQIEEAEALINGFFDRGVSSEDVQIGTLKCSSVPVLDMLVAVGGNGKAQFGVQTQYLIDRCPEAKLLVCVGAAGRLVKTLAVGDVVVGTATIEHDYKERFIQEPLPCHEADPEVLMQFTRVASAREFPFRVFFGPIASGDEDIVDPIRAAETHVATQALCAAWEGSGGARAARFSRIGFLEIRAITDAADEHAAKAFHENLRSAVPNVADLIIAWHAETRAAA
jgi:adenosylhomocysteine nucleosidase